MFRAHAGFVASFSVRLGVPPDEIDDQVQEVFLVAHRRGGYTPGPAKPTTWLAEIALRVASGRRRTARRRKLDLREDPGSTAEAPQPDPFVEAANRESLNRVQDALDALPSDRRAVFVLFEIEGESCDAIAAGLGIPTGTVYSRLHKARREFKAAYSCLQSGEIMSAQGAVG